MPVVRVRSIPPERTHDLRRRVLRQGVPDPRVDLPIDHRADAWHLGAEVEGRLVGVVSFYDEPSAARPGRRCRQFRFMAVDPAFRGRGVGRALLAAALDRLRGEGVECVWANARDTALGFYRAMGFQAVGEGFIHEETGLPHTVVVLDISGPFARP